MSRFRVDEPLYSQDGVNWFEEPFHGPERKPIGVVTAVDVETGTITISTPWICIPDEDR